MRRASKGNNERQPTGRNNGLNTFTAPKLPLSRTGLKIRLMIVAAALLFSASPVLAQFQVPGRMHRNSPPEKASRDYSDQIPSRTSSATMAFARRVGWRVRKQD